MVEWETEPPSDDDFHKRGYSLPEGCKDISDAIKQREGTKQPPAPQFPPITRRVKLPSTVAVRFIAEVSGKSLQSIMHLMWQLHIGGEPNRSIEFEKAQRILRHLGIWAERDGTD